MVIDEDWKGGVVWRVFESGLYVPIFGKAHGEMCLSDVDEALHIFLGLWDVIEVVEGERGLHGA